jgi:hypothetical protein
VRGGAVREARAGEGCAGGVGGGAVARPAAEGGWREVGLRARVAEEGGFGQGAVGFEEFDCGIDALVWGLLGTTATYACF